MSFMAAPRVTCVGKQLLTLPSTEEKLLKGLPRTTQNLKTRQGFNVKSHAANLRD